jgi:hypothetical protein
VKHSMTVKPLREPLIVRTVVASQQPIAIADFSVNLMEASSLGTDGRPVAATKTSKVQDEKLRILEVAGEIPLRRQVRSTHSRERASDLRRQCVDISRIPHLFLERAGARKRRRQRAGKAEQNRQGDKAGNCTHRRNHLPAHRASMRRTLVALALMDNQRIRSWALYNVSMHFFRPTCSSFDRGGSRTLRQPSRPTTAGSESVTPSFKL